MIVRDIFHHIIGDIDHGEFYKQIRGSKHLLRNPEPAIAIDAFAYDSIISKHANGMVVKDMESLDKYCITTKLFTMNRQPLDRGHGKQYFVPLRLWTVNTTPQGRLL